MMLVGGIASGAGSVAVGLGAMLDMLLTVLEIGLCALLWMLDVMDVGGVYLNCSSKNQVFEF